MKKTSRELMILFIVGTFMLMFQNESSAQIKLVKYVSGSGGIMFSNSQNYFHSGTSGQVLLGGQGNSNHILFSGFWTFPFKEPLNVKNTENEIIPEKFELYQNYPNPFNPTTTIAYDLPELSTVRIVIYNISGQRVRNLVSSKAEPPGHKIVVWDGRNDSGEMVSSGIYFYHAFINSHSSQNVNEDMYQHTMKMLLLK